MWLIVPCGRTGSTVWLRMMGLDRIRLTIECGDWQRQKDSTPSFRCSTSKRFSNGFRAFPYQHIPHPKGLEHVFVAHIRVEQTIGPKRNPLLNRLLVLHGKEGVESF